MRANEMMTQTLHEAVGRVMAVGGKMEMPTHVVDGYGIARYDLYAYNEPPALEWQAEVVGNKGQSRTELVDRVTLVAGELVGYHSETGIEPPQETKEGLHSDTLTYKVFCMLTNAALRG